jgi:hypothetical protein
MLAQSARFLATQQGNTVALALNSPADTQVQNALSGVLDDIFRTALGGQTQCGSYLDHTQYISQRVVKLLRAEGFVVTWPNSTSPVCEIQW